MKSFSIVGAGRLGTALGAALVRRGWKAVAVIDKDADAARESRRIIGQGRATTDIRLPAGTADIVFITVPDDAVERVAARLARAGVRWAGRFVFHTSGLLSARALGPLRKRGAAVASVHPVQSFPVKEAKDRLFKGIAWGLEGDPAAVEAACALVGDLGGHVLLLSEKEKPLYHAACSLASNALVALEGTAASLLRIAGIGEKEAGGLLLPLVQGTLQNVKNLGQAKALTGPVARGDIDTVRKHLEALRDDPGALEVYRALGRQALLLVPAGACAPGRLKAMRRLLEGG